MCMRSDHAVPALSQQQGQPAQASQSARTVDVDHVKQCLQEAPAGFALVDVREPDELSAEGAKSIPEAISYPLGPLLRDVASNDAKHGLKEKSEIVLICNVGYRSGVAAQQLSTFGLPAASLDGGVEAYHAPKSAWFKPEYVVVLETHHEEKATLGFSIATASQVNGRKTAMVLMSTSPLLFRREGVKSKVIKRYADIKVGEPFKPMADVVKKFLSSGGTIFACKSCVRFSGLEYSKMEDNVFPMQAPDLVRMTACAQGSTSMA